MKRVFLVRHGETDWNRQMRIQGRENIPLNNEGRAQAQGISRYLSKKNVAAVFSSPLSRAQETANIIAVEHGLTPAVVDGLAEINFGNLAGKTYAEMDESDRAVMAQWLSDPAQNAIPGGESLQQFQQRLEACYQKLLDNHPAGNLVVVTHAGAIKVLVAGVLEIPLSRITRLRLVTASLTVILYDDWGNPYLELFNGAGHLQEE